MRNLLAGTLLVAAVLCWVCAAQALEVEGVQIHGFASQGYIKTSKHNNFPVTTSGKGSFTFNDFAINVSKEILPDLRVGLQLLAMDRGSYGQDKITLD